MINPTMDITKEELEKVLSGISAEGKISKEAEEVIVARIAEGRERNLPLLEVKRQFRAHLDAEPGIKVAAAIEKLWYK